MSAHRVSVALALCLAMTVGTKDARTQFSPRARSAGMAGAGLLFATGLDTVEWNPANLAWSTGWDVSLFEFGAAGLLTGTTIDDLIEIASAGGDGDAAVVNRLPDDGFTLSTTVEGFASARAASVADLPEVGSSIPSVGLAIGPVALRVRSRLMAEASMSRELADLTVNGYNPERIQEYAVRNTNFRAASFTEITLGYGITIGESLALGLGVRSVRGHSLSQGRFFEPVIDLNEETLAVTGAVVEALGGSGYGLDLGMALDLGAGVRVSLVGTNVMQRMTWDEELVAHQAVFSDDESFVGLGGNVVFGSFYWQVRSGSGKETTGWGGLEGVDPFSSSGGAVYRDGSLGTVSSHPLTEGLTSLTSDGLWGGVAALGGTTVVASWNDRTPLVGYRKLSVGQRMVDVSIFPAHSTTCCVSGDTGTLWKNAVRWAGAAGGPARAGVVAGGN